MKLHQIILVLAIGKTAALDCGEYTITPGESYPIESPNYPDKYGKKDSCKWEFTCDEIAGVIGISCDDFKTEEDAECKNADFLKVADSTGTIDYFCGTSGPDLESADNFLEVKFGTDNDGTVKRGFSCSVVCTVKTTTPKPTDTTPILTTTIINPTGLLGCGEHSISSGMSYTIESPNYPDKYGKKDNCKWEFTCDESAGVIGISCDDFKTEEEDPCKNADFLKIADSTGTIDYFCGTSGPDLESADNFLEVKFGTDNDGTVKKGFSCSVVCTVKTTTPKPTTTTPIPTTTTPIPTTTTPIPTTTTPIPTTTIPNPTTTTGLLGCGEHSISSEMSYTIESPNYPNTYGKKDSCKWEFTCDESAGVIGISCDDFKTEEDAKCKKADFLKITDSTGTIDYFCGTNGPDLESADNFLEVKFGTDNDGTVKRGFSCSVVCTVKTTTPKPTDTTPIPTTTIINPTGLLGCGEHSISSGMSYTIESPNYPDKYGKKDNCKWEFTCDESAGVIGISCDDFKTEEDDPCKKADFLKVADSTGTIDYFCGTSGPDLESSENFLEVKFGTDNDGTVKRGFSCSVVCTVKTTTPKPTTTTPIPTTTTPIPTTTTPIPTTTTPIPTTTTPIPTTTTPIPTTTTPIPTTTIPNPTTTTGLLGCGEHSISPGMSYPIESPNYPDKYGKKDSCKWEFTCDESAGVIGISCDDFNTEEAAKCKKADFLKVADSTGTIDYFCGTSGPDLESADNFLELNFNTDGDKKVKKGFSCSVFCTVKTTTPKTTTTTPEPTTTTPKPSTTPDWSGNCSKTITAYDDMTEYWVSPNYDGTTHYPEGEYCCSLNITIPDTYSMFQVTMIMDSPSSIYETSQCVHDHIDYTSSSSQTTTLCGDVSGQTWSEIAVFDTPLKFSFTWCSTAEDGHTDIGFKMEITGSDLLNT